MSSSNDRLIDINDSELLGELRRRKHSDPLAKFVPTPSQLDYLTSTSSRTFVTGPNRSGKTAIELADIAWTLRGDHPWRPALPGPAKFAIVVLSLSQFSSVFQGKLFRACGMAILGKEAESLPLISARHISATTKDYVNAGEPIYRWTRFSNGNELYVIPGDSPKSWSRIQGMALAGVWQDEDCGSEDLIDELILRTADWRGRAENPEDETPPWAGFISMFATVTTGSPAVMNFYDGCAAGINGGRVIKLKADENPAVNRDVIRKDAGFMSQAAQRTRIEGTSTAAGERMHFPEWDRSRHLLAEPYKIKPSDNIVLGLDPGTEHPAGLALNVLPRERPDTLIVVRSDQRLGMNIAQYVAIFREWLQGRRVRAIVVDPSMNQKSMQTARRSVEILQEALTAAGLRGHEDPSRTPPIVLGHPRREYAMNCVKRMLHNHINPKEQPRILVSPDENYELERQVVRLRYIKSGTNKSHRGQAGDDHIIDAALRYPCSAVESKGLVWKDLGSNLPNAPMPGAAMSRYEQILQESRQAIVERFKSPPTGWTSSKLF